MACLDNVQISQTITYINPDTTNGLVSGTLDIEISNITGSSVVGTVTVDKVRDLSEPLSSPAISETDTLTSTSQSFNYNFYYPQTEPENITINVAVSFQYNGCIYKLTCNHLLFTPNNANEDSVCSSLVQGYEIVSGCTDSAFYEYNPNANVDDGSCSTLIPIEGCTNPLAVNYNPLATKNDGSCIYPSGCTNPLAVNYNPKAVIDDGSCECGDNNIELSFFDTTGQTFPIEENCQYVLEFDLKTEINCTEFLTYFQSDTRTVLDILGGLKINAQALTAIDSSGSTVEYTGGTIELGSGTTYNLSRERELYTFDINNTPTGLGLIPSEDCDTLKGLIATELGLECQSLDENLFVSTGETYQFTIEDDLANTFTKYVINFSGFKFGIRVYIDNIKFTKICETPFKNCTLIPSSYGFDLELVKDNKKSWVYSKSEKRHRYAVKGRETDYTNFDSRLLFNTKNIDLHLDPIKYVESDVVEYFNYYQNFFKDLDVRLTSLTQDSIKNFIDVKSRQVIRSYPLLQTTYQRYLDELGCAPSKRIGYVYGFEILDKVGDDWYHLVKQLLPATVIWDEAQYKIRNNIFHTQKHRYKKYSLEVGNNFGGSCAPSGVTLECNKISEECFDAPLEDIADLFSGTSLVCSVTGDSVCYNAFDGNGSFSGKLIEYTQSGDTREILTSIGFENYDCTTDTGDTVVVLGCTDPNADNYNPNANVDDGSCYFCDFISGCTYPSATNYNSSSNFDDGSCEFPTGATQVNCIKTESFSFDVDITNTSSIWSITTDLSSSSSYSGDLMGSYKIYGLKNPEILGTQPNISSSVSTPIVLSDYIEFGFNSLTPSPVVNTGNPWWFTFASDGNIPDWTAGNNIQIDIVLMTDNNCIYKGTSNITLPNDGNTNTISINLT